MAFSKFPDKDPDAILDYYFIWYEWLGGAGGATISTATVVATNGITVVSSSIVASEVILDSTTYPANTVVTCRLSGGVVGRIYEVTCHITDSDTQEDDKTRTVKIKQR